MSRGHAVGSEKDVEDIELFEQRSPSVALLRSTDSTALARDPNYVGTVIRMHRYV